MIFSFSCHCIKDPVSLASVSFFRTRWCYDSFSSFLSNSLSFFCCRECHFSHSIFSVLLLVLHGCLLLLMSKIHSLWDLKMMPWWWLQKYGKEDDDDHSHQSKMKRYLLQEEEEENPKKRFHSKRHMASKTSLWDVSVARIGIKERVEIVTEKRYKMKYEIREKEMDSFSLSLSSIVETVLKSLHFILPLHHHLVSCSGLMTVCLCPSFIFVSFIWVVITDQSLCFFLSFFLRRKLSSFSSSFWFTACCSCPCKRFFDSFFSFCSLASLQLL